MIKFLLIISLIINIQGFSQEPLNPYKLISEGHRLYIKNTGDSATPLNHYRKAEKLFKKQKNNVGLAESFHFQGALYLDYNDYQKGELYLRKAVNLLENTSADSTLVKTLQSLSFYYWKSGYLRKALNSNHQIESILFKNPDLEEQKNLQIYLFASFNNVARLYDELGDIKNAEIYFRKSSEFALAKGIDRYVSSGLKNEALFYQSIGHYQEATSLFKKALNSSFYQTSKADIHVLLSSLYKKNNDLLAANIELKRAEKIYTQIRRQNSEVIEAESTIKYLQQSADYNLAIGELEKAKKSSEQILKYEGYLLEKATALYRLAEVSFRKGQLKEAIEYNTHGLKILRFNSKSTSKAYDYKLCIELLEQQIKFKQNVNEKLKIYSVLAQLIELNRRTMNFEKSKTHIIKTLQPILHDGILLAHENNNSRLLDKLLAVYQAGLLSDNLSKIYNTNQNDFKFLEQKELVGRLNRINIELIENPEKSDLLKKQNEVLLKLNQIYFENKKENEDFIKSMEQINSDEAVIQFVDLGNQYLIYLKTNNIAISNLLISAPINQTIDNLNKSLWQNPGVKPFKAEDLTHNLYKFLMEPIESHLTNITHIRIIKDGFLNYLPFEVLQNGTGYLLQQYSFQYDYTEAKPFVATPNQNKNISLLSFAPYINLSRPLGSRSLGNLPFSEKEVDVLSGTSYKNQTATKNRFIEDYQKHGIIHFATHAQMDDTDPSKSFIAFYPDSSDYKLYTEELYNLSLQKTQLVVLSACEAGGGKLQKGEGLMSLARGFAYAGCPAVITTLWKANDQSTAWLSERLHHYLGKGWNKAEALRQAKLDFRASDVGQKFDHPYYWANFILIGDDAPLQMTLWEEYKWGVLASLIFTIIMCFIFCNRRFSKTNVKIKP